MYSISAKESQDNIAKMQKKVEKELKMRYNRTTEKITTRNTKKTYYFDGDIFDIS